MNKYLRDRGSIVEIGSPCPVDRRIVRDDSPITQIIPYGNIDVILYNFPMASAAGATREPRGWYAAAMTTDSTIELSGPFQARDGNGRTHDVKAIRIFDEGYGIIDVYVEFKAKLDPGAYRDDVLVHQIVDRLRAVGYQGPDFGHSDPGLQESRLIVLEAPEEFAAFAKRRGWKNLAEEFDD
jgi:hypothetical protein